MNAFNYVAKSGQSSKNAERKTRREKQLQLPSITTTARTSRGIKAAAERAATLDAQFTPRTHRVATAWKAYAPTLVVDNTPKAVRAPKAEKPAKVRKAA